MAAVSRFVPQVAGSPAVVAVTFAGWAVLAVLALSYLLYGR